MDMKVINIAHTGDRNKKYPTSNTGKDSKARYGTTTNDIPVITAAPFPPLKPIYTGKLCPTIKASATT